MNSVTRSIARNKLCPVSAFGESGDSGQYCWANKCMWWVEDAGYMCPACSGEAMSEARCCDQNMLKKETGRCGGAH